MISASDPFRGVNRLSREGFRRIMLEKAAPEVVAERDPGAYWDVIRSYDLDTCFVLAMFNHESTMGRFGMARTTHSFGNTRPPSFGVPHIGVNNNFSVYRDWLDGCKSTSARLVAPDWVYSGPSRNAETGETFGPRTAIRELFIHPSEQVWAPAGDNNDPDGYLNAVIRDMNAWSDGGAPMPTPTPRTYRVALAAGHHNTSGGNHDEHEQTGQLTPAIAAALRARGFEVRVITPDEGRGDYPGTLSDVAKQVRPDDDLFLEVHTEGVANPNVRGIFAIYPDWGTDVDTDVRDTLGPAIAKAVSAATGLPVRGSGTMSEKMTGVGGQGFRLGVFGATEHLKATCTRLIVEYGAHTNAADMAIWAQPDFLQRAAGATADAIAGFYGVALPPKEPAGPTPAVSDPNAQHFPQTDKWVVNDPAPMLTAWRNKGGVAVCGYPLTGMTQDADGVYRQTFENVLIEIYPDGLIRFGGLGQRYMAALARIAELEAA